MGKDNIPFHTVIFPCTLMGAKDDYTLLHHISVTEYLNYEEAKFSKSNGTGVFGDDVESTGVPVEIWRYYLLSIRPETSDTIFKWDDILAKTNNELAANIGNLC
jgi:methionyl-tRNA synthetase